MKHQHPKEADSPGQISVRSELRVADEEIGTPRKV